MRHSSNSTRLPRGATRPPRGSWRLSTADLSGVATLGFDDVQGLEAALCRALGTASQGIAFRAHRFSPRGLSLVGIGERIRLVLHTWPENDEATIDLYAPDGESEMLLERCVTLFVSARVEP
jgi:S-adenosylmethionine/arginine decarboxylase-like enzyme